MLFTGKKIKCELIFKDKQYTLDIERHKTINDLYNMFLEIAPDVNYPIMLRLSTNQHPFEGKDFDNPLLSLINEKEEDLIFEVTKSNKCPQCSSLNNDSKNNKDNTNKNIFISKYCLTCNKYICDICFKKTDTVHHSHNLIDINPNDLKNSVKLWCINLIADLSGQITSFKKQTEFMNDSDFLIKLELWKNNILSKLNRFETLIKNIFERCKNFGKYYQNLEDVYNKVMQNLIKSEREMNEDLFFENKNKIKYFSFDEAEELIQKLKSNYEEIEKVKKEIKPIIDINNINSMEKNMNNIPMSFDQLTTSTLLIIDNINNYENDNQKDNLEKIYKYPDFFIHQKNNKSFTYSTTKIIKPKKKDNYFISSQNTSHNKNRDNYISKNEINLTKKSYNTNNYKNEGKLITQITKLSDIPASYSIVEYSKFLKKNEEKKLNNNIKVLSLRNSESQKTLINKGDNKTNKQNNYLSLPFINNKMNNDKEKIKISVNKSVNINQSNNKIFRSMDNRYKRKK